MKEDRTAFWFRIRVILSTLLVLLGAGLFFAGYYGYAKKWGIPIEVSFFGSGGMIIAGFAIRATLFHCPFCGAHIYLRNPVYCTSTLAQVVGTALVKEKPHI